MKLDLIPYEGLEQTNQKVREILNVPSQNSILSYLGIGRALLEVTQTLAQFYSHKKTIAIFNQESPYCQAALQYFYKEGYEIQIFENGADPIEWVKSLKKETCFVLSVNDHPITGKINSILGVSKELEVRKIIHLVINHHDHLTQTSFLRSQAEINNYLIEVRSYGPNTAVVVAGPKVKLPVISGGFSYWNVERFIFELKQVKQNFVENKSSVIEFESHLPKGFEAFFDINSDQRVFDRSVVYHRSRGGEGLQHFLMSRLNLPLAKVGFESRIETPHLCRWGGTLSHFSWWNDRPDEAVVRGMLLLSPEVIVHPQIEEALTDAIKECGFDGTY